jgi:Tfp pilus assembly protein PilX
MIFKNYNRGVALFIALALLFLLSIGAIAVLLTAYNYTCVTENQIKRLQAISLAEAGINYAYWKIRIGKDDNGDDIVYPCELTPPIDLPSGYSIEVDITEEVVTGKKTIESKVIY